MELSLEDLPIESKIRILIAVEVSSARFQNQCAVRAEKRGHQGIAYGRFDTAKAHLSAAKNIAQILGRLRCMKAAHRPAFLTKAA